jgi:multiple sugar transport system permease protein
VLPLAIPGLISAFIFCFTLCSTVHHAHVHLIVPAQDGAGRDRQQFVDGDIYRWGSLMAGALVGSLPLVVLYAFFVEHYVSAMTGAVKE